MMLVMKNKKIGVIGVGVIGSILLELLCLKHNNSNIFVFERNKDIVLKIKKKYKNIVFIKEFKDLSSLDVIFCCIKPQDFNIFPSIPVKNNKLIISVMAGISIGTLKKKFNSNKIIRTMPNLPVKIGKGVVGWCASGDVSVMDRKFFERIVDSMGYLVFLSKEKELDKITAISGSGPGYIFYMIYCFLNASLALFPKDKDKIKKIVLQTIKGSVELIENDVDLRLLVDNVASKGGTTEAALNIFLENNTERIWKNAVMSAYKKSKLLSK